MNIPEVLTTQHSNPIPSQKNRASFERSFSHAQHQKPSPAASMAQPVLTPSTDKNQSLGLYVDIYI